MNRATAAGIAIAAVLASTLGTALAVDPPESTFVPLQRGNLWHYISFGMGNATVRANEGYDFFGYHATRVEGFLFPITAKDIYLMTDRCQWTCEVNPKASTARGDQLFGTWYCCSHSIYEGQKVVLPAFYDDCIHGTKGTVVNKGAPVTVPAGTFDWSVTILYEENPCSNLRVWCETLVPNVGVVRRVVQTPDAWHTFDLKYAVISGRLIGSPAAEMRPATMVDPWAAPELTPTTWGAIKRTYAD